MPDEYKILNRIHIEADEMEAFIKDANQHFNSLEEHVAYAISFYLASRKKPVSKSTVPSAEIEFLDMYWQFRHQARDIRRVMDCANIYNMRPSEENYDRLVSMCDKNEMDIDDVLARSKGSMPSVIVSPNGNIERCQYWLVELLKDGTPMLVSEIVQKAMKFGYSKDVLNKAKQRINRSDSKGTLPRIPSSKLGSVWQWSLVFSPNEGDSDDTHSRKMNMARKED